MKSARAHRVIRRSVPVAAAVAAAQLLAGCGAGGAGATGDQARAAAASPAARIDCAAKSQLPGSGSTAQQNVMKYWIQQYQRACPDVQIAYNPLGSGAGAAQFLRGATAFGGSDSALKPAEVALSRQTCTGGRAIDLPMAGGPIAVGYNLPGVDGLVLDAATLAGIFDTRITTWDAPEIRRLNPGVKLPSARILTVHRSDDSGTTQNLQAYLAGAAPAAWPYPAEKSWQGRGGGSANGSSGVAAEINSSYGSIGYFELSFAASSRIPAVRVDTGTGRPVAPSPESASAGIAGARLTGEGKDMSLTFRYGRPAAGAYPIVQVTYEIVCDKGNRAATLPALRSFLTYTAGDEGQRVLSRMHYAPLPGPIAAQVRRTVRSLS
ncbi:phosphate ABC transporter substrate-binding protein PstS [Streptomyces antnestii]|uniref:Phosphate-binding protein n=1 Tax=Streptomyces antnestii TaxID=2494256 RepID=A0A437PZR7_9ACTN|nr:phosphate ABC transporter substrate-binding protein PstS [Streptomyces sp. San01]RVU27774.1 phosphate ABC transporter substrate-binding protein PstS [Streptomyces sp. San01]